MKLKFLLAFTLIYSLTSYGNPNFILETDVPNLSINSINEENISTKKNLKSFTAQEINKISEALYNLYDGHPYYLAQGAFFLKKSEMSTEEYVKKIQSADNKNNAHIKLVFQELTPQEIELVCKLSLVNKGFISSLTVKLINNDHQNLLGNINTLIEYNLITMASSEKSSELEMHDLTSTSIIETQEIDTIKKYINEISYKLALATQLLPVTDPNYNNLTFNNNIEAFLIQVEKYRIENEHIPHLVKFILQTQNLGCEPEDVVNP